MKLKAIINDTLQWLIILAAIAMMFYAASLGWHKAAPAYQVVVQVEAK